MNFEDILGIGSRVDHPSYGNGVVIAANIASYDICFIMYGIKQIAKDYNDWIIVEKIDTQEKVSFSDAEKSLIKILKTWSDVTELVPLGDKWKGGQMILKPEDEALKSKDIPIETFFHKIVMVRDKIRVMEQRINSSANLSDEEKFNLQQYISRIYGSLTTFNVLFKYKTDHFSAAKTK